ncbi:hypothetical protein NDU88_005535 [Pleurodeles waltl]|uniref:Uncharacterized protein n=1 Tax=Pleurodeles waltl TaxID=8319 RepID=A0AAV7WC31_PLEWA|nr:hypothetical protein NDU88_005535 [Pleurodeles waltl]
MAAITTVRRQAEGIYMPTTRKQRKGSPVPAGVLACLLDKPGCEGFFCSVEGRKADAGYSTQPSLYRAAVTRFSSRRRRTKERMKEH